MDLARLDEVNLSAAIFSSTNYERPMLLQRCTQRGLSAVSETEEEAEALGVHLQWGKARDLIWQPILDGNCVGSCHPVFSALSRKADLARCLQKHSPQQGRGLQSAITPITLVLDLDNSDSDSEDEGGAPTLGTKGNWREMVERLLSEFPDDVKWVLKDSDSNRGENLYVVRGGAAGVEEVHGILSSKQRGCWVLQQYVTQLLLLDGRKCHLRVHALVLGDSAVAVHRHTLVLPASLPFTMEQDSLANPLVHATNVYQQKACGEKAFDGSFTLAEAVKIWSKAGGVEDPVPTKASCSAHAGTDLLQQLTLCSLKKLEATIHQAVASLFTSVSAVPLGFFPLSNCFQLFGIDFLLDQQLSLHLLEVNSDPSLSIFGDRLKDKAAELVSDTLDVGIDMAQRMLGGNGEPPRYSGAVSGDGGSDGFVRVLELAPRFKSSSARGIVRRLLLQCGLLSKRPSQNKGTGGGSTSGAPSAGPHLAAVSPFAVGAAQAKEALESNQLWTVTEDARLPGVLLQWASHKEIRWERVMDKSMAASCYFTRRALASSKMAAQLYMLIAAYLADLDTTGNCARTHGANENRSHPMPLTMSVKPTGGKSSWEERLREALAGTALTEPSDYMWHCCPAHLPFWSREEGGTNGRSHTCPAVPWSIATDMMFGQATPLLSSGAPQAWLLQCAIPGALMWRGAPLHVRAHLLVVGACVGLLHSQIDVMSSRCCGSESEDSDAREVPLLEALRDSSLAGGSGAGAAAALMASVRAGVQTTSHTLLAAACEMPRLSGFLPARNCFEIFRLRFAVSTDGAAWLLSCEPTLVMAARPTNHGQDAREKGDGHGRDFEGRRDQELDQQLVQEALSTAVPLLGLPGLCIKPDREAMKDSTTVCDTDVARLSIHNEGQGCASGEVPQGSRSKCVSGHSPFEEVFRWNAKAPSAIK